MKNSLGKLIAEMRKQKGMTQLELAEKMGVTDKAVSKWERELACPDIHTLPALAEALGLSVDELMQGKCGRLPENGRTGVILNTVFRGVALAMGVVLVLARCYGCAVQKLVYSARGTLIFLPSSLP